MLNSRSNIQILIKFDLNVIITVLMLIYLRIKLQANLFAKSLNDLITN